MTDIICHKWQVSDITIFGKGNSRLCSANFKVAIVFIACVYLLHFFILEMNNEYNSYTSKLFLGTGIISFLNSFLRFSHSAYALFLCKNATSFIIHVLQLQRNEVITSLIIWMHTSYLKHTGKLVVSCRSYIKKQF